MRETSTWLRRWTGRFIMVFGLIAVAPGNGRAIVTEIINAESGLDGPYDIAVDGSANVYVSGVWSDNAFKITPGGVITEIINAASGGDVLSGIAVDGEGNVYVTGSGSDNAFKITPGGVITLISM